MKDVKRSTVEATTKRLVEHGMKPDAAKEQAIKVAEKINRDRKEGAR